MASSPPVILSFRYPGSAKFERILLAEADECRRKVARLQERGAVGTFALSPQAAPDRFSEVFTQPPPVVTFAEGDDPDPDEQEEYCLWLKFAGAPKWRKMFGPGTRQECTDFKVKDIQDEMNRKGLLGEFMTCPADVDPNVTHPIKGDDADPDEDDDRLQ
ncbi:MAG TPA: hypothetical protein VGZ47_08910 [Gemmataceae bacterium]|jgi:hypothetical protein|nr:hypothetical protein [Gemmataceae bacterium]